eukprot:CAMPEP_0174372510 /NCGR_PEP_ID=MMETSP0811_2-20130205/103913_1 /TAXON_ID=73025 ORGANISM="Eutreptiella gymnastica-like, Strain CCMP1594" /NCGR_SAMPLE_ID=MMETSP0811_2 /ASSEMBLY_ACC=CAM_ASM_000667 /LENGTH=627 /DNA_ID=CAMNT_0015520017 /DNA_START=57 /DNA_END=1936 /DNA_ORIENTATION=+
MNQSTLVEISVLEAKCEELMMRMDARATAISRTGTAQQAADANDWKKAEHDALEDWKAAESLVLKEWRERETLDLSEWKEREVLASAWSRISIEMAKLAQKDKRTLLEVEIESMEMHCSALIERVDTRAHGLLYALRPDQTRQMEDFEAHTKQQKGHSRQVELWLEIRRLEELAKRQQVERMLQKGDLIVELDETAQKEREAKEQQEAQEQAERENQQKEARARRAKEKERKKFTAGMLTFLASSGKKAGSRPGTAGSVAPAKEAQGPMQLSSAHLLSDCIHKGRVSLEVRIALLGAFRFLNEFDLARSCTLASREFYQMLADDRLINDRRRDTLQTLEDLGIQCITVPRGTYTLGKPMGIAVEEVSYMGQNTSTAPYFCAQQEYTQGEDVLLCSDVVTLGMWDKLVQAYPHLEGIVTENDIKLSRYNVIHGSLCGKREATVIEKDLEEADPALELPYKTCVKIAKALGATIPTWQQWEAAVRGPQAWLYPWGNDFDHVRMEIEVMIHGWSAPNPNYGKANKMGLKDTAAEVHKTLALSRLCDWSIYAGAVSPLGLKGLCRFGKEWNSANHDVRCYLPEDVVETQVLRSLCDLHSVNDAHSWDTPVREELLASNHRSFSGPMGFCLR